MLVAMTPFRRMAIRLALTGAALLPLLSLAGCGRGPVVLSDEQVRSVGRELDALERLPSAPLDSKVAEYRRILAEMQDKGSREEAGRVSLLMGYAFERQGKFPEADSAYQRAGGSGCGYAAAFRMGEIARLERADLGQAERAYNNAVPPLPGVKGWMRVTGSDGKRPVLANQVGGRLELVELQEEARKRLDAIYQGTTSYRFIDYVVRLLGNRPEFSHALALLLLALLIKIVTTPLTNMSFRSMRRMQALQPLFKDLQARLGKDREAAAREQFALMRKHKVNPMGGCLPMLVQMPILIWMYRAIQHYIYRLHDARFLWVPSLAQPDLPLLLLYALSMYVSQKALTMPSPDPQQQKTQQMMTWMMPLFLTTVLATVASAFILYWLAFNVCITAHQMWMMRRPLPVIEPQQADQRPAPAGPPPRLRPKRKKR